MLLVCPAGTNRLEEAIRAAQAGQSDSYAADLGSGKFLFCRLPQGLEATSVPHLRIGDREVARQLAIPLDARHRQKTIGGCLESGSLTRASDVDHATGR